MLFVLFVHLIGNHPLIFLCFYFYLHIKTIIFPPEKMATAQSDYKSDCISGITSFFINIIVFIYLAHIVRMNFK